jgi:hypothetical protein
MAWTPEVSSVNQRVQVGAESLSALGTAVPANRYLEMFDWKIGIAPDVIFYTPTGHKYATVQEENMEWVDGEVSGWIDYNGSVYILGGAMGAVSPVAHGSSAIAKDWIFIPPITGSIVPQTLTVQQGDQVRARQFTYGLFNDFGYKITRKEATLSSKFVGQPLADGITLTASPTSIVAVPVVGKQVDVYLDTTFAALGTTQLLRVLSLDYAFSGIYGQIWPLNRSTIGFTTHVDSKPATTIKILEEANAEGMSFLSYLQGGQTGYLRVQGQGSCIDNLQTVTLGVQTSGNFTLTYLGQTTGNIAYNATAAAVQTALSALSSIPTGAVAVTGAAGGPYNIDFSGVLLTNPAALTGNFSGLTTPANASIAQNQSYYAMTHDMAIKVGKPTAFQDSEGVYALEWECTIVEDPIWGNAQKLTFTNLLTAL